MILNKKEEDCAEISLIRPGKCFFFFNSDLEKLSLSSNEKINQEKPKLISSVLEKNDNDPSLYMKPSEELLQTIL